MESWGAELGAETWKLGSSRGGGVAVNEEGVRRAAVVEQRRRSCGSWRAEAAELWFTKKEGTWKLGSSLRLIITGGNCGYRATA